MISSVLKVLSGKHILLQGVPSNFTYLFQLLDVQVGPDLSVNRMMKKKFTNWYVDQITQAMSQGQELQQIEIPLKLLNVNPLYAKWLIEIYNEMTSADGKQVCLKGQQVAGIKDAVTQGLSSSESLDLFRDIDRQSFWLSAASKYVCEYGSEDECDEEEWVEENEEEENRNIFDLFDGEEDL